MTPEALRTLRWTELTAALFMTGVIWFVQVVHYPLFARVGGDYPAYQAEHMSRTGLVVIGPMLVELAAALALTAVDGGAARWLSTSLLAVVWASTFFLQVPLHEALARTFDSGVQAKLVSTNWIRTVAWTARAAILVASMRT